MVRPPANTAKSLTTYGGERLVRVRLSPYPPAFLPAQGLRKATVDSVDCQRKQFAIGAIRRGDAVSHHYDGEIPSLPFGFLASRCGSAIGEVNALKRHPMILPATNMINVTIFRKKGPRPL